MAARRNTVTRAHHLVSIQTPFCRSSNLSIRQTCSLAHLACSYTSLVYHGTDEASGFRSWGEEAEDILLVQPPFPTQDRWDFSTRYHAQ